MCHAPQVDSADIPLRAKGKRMPDTAPELCYQCGKCSAGCPVTEEMDLLPHQLMHLLALGQEDRVLASNTAWICASCYTCATRCPNNIDITGVMDDLRKKCVDRKLPCPQPDVLTFHRTFLTDMARRGRVHELRFMGEYNLRSGHLLKDVELAPKMLLSRRLRLLPPKRVRGFRSWIKRLWKSK